MKIRLKKLFGFRSGTPWKSGVAIVYYFVCISFFVIAMITPPLIPAQRWDTAVVKMSSIVLCAWILTPAVFLSETKMRMKLPFFKDHLGLRSLVGLMITSVFFLYLFMMMEGLHTPAYKEAFEKYIYATFDQFVQAGTVI